MGAALRLDRQAVLRDGDLLGRLLDTFVTAQLRPEATLSRRRPRHYHLRDKNGRHEIDLLAQLRVVGGMAGEPVGLPRARRMGLAVARSGLRD